MSKGWVGTVVASEWWLRLMAVFLIVVMPLVGMFWLLGSWGLLAWWIVMAVFLGCPGLLCRVASSLLLVAAFSLAHDLAGWPGVGLLFAAVLSCEGRRREAPAGGLHFPAPGRHLPRAATS